jgi:hypothetical protein
MTALCATRKTARLVPETQLDRIIPIAIDGFDLQNMTRTRLNNGHRNQSSIRLKYLRHSDLSAEYTFSHDQIPSSLALQDSQPSRAKPEVASNRRKIAVTHKASEPYKGNP